MSEASGIWTRCSNPLWTIEVRGKCKVKPLLLVHGPCKGLDHPRPAGYPGMIFETCFHHALLFPKKSSSMKATWMWIVSSPSVVWKASRVNSPKHHIVYSLVISSQEPSRGDEVPWGLPYFPRRAWQELFKRHSPCLPLTRLPQKRIAYFLNGYWYLSSSSRKAWHSFQ